MCIAISPVHVPPDGGEPVFLVGDTYTTLLKSTQTNGELSLVEAIVPVNAGPPMHTHHGESETFMVMDGQLVITADGDEYEASAGAVVYVPKGVKHSFRNNSHSKPARMYFLYTPGGMDAMFTEIGTPGVRGQVGPPLNEVDVKAMGAVADKYGYTFD